MLNKLINNNKVFARIFGVIAIIIAPIYMPYLFIKNYKDEIKKEIKWYFLGCYRLLVKGSNNYYD